MTEPVEKYLSNLDHLRDELARLDLTLERAVARMRATNRSLASAGSFVSPEEAQALLAPGPSSGSVTPDDPQEPDESGDRIEQYGEAISRKLAEAGKNAVPLRLPRLARLFSLSRFEMDVLVMCLAPEWDLKYRRLYGYLHDDVTKRHPSIALVLKLLCRELDEEMRARPSFGPSAPLLRYRLISVLRDDADPAAPLLARQIKIDDGIAAYLLHADGLDPAVARAAVLTEPASFPEEAGETDSAHARVAEVVRAYPANAERRAVYYFHGQDAEAMKMAARAACRGEKSALLQADMKILIGEGEDPEQQVLYILREGILKSAAVLLENYDWLWAPESKFSHLLPALQRLIGEMGWLVFLTGARPWPNRDMSEDQVLFEFEFPVPDAPARKRCWEAALNNKHRLADDVDLDALSATFRLTRGQIRDAVLVARNRSLLRQGEDRALPGAELYAAARACSNRSLAAFGRKIAPRFGWDDLVLPPDMLAQLREFCGHARFRGRVYGEWAFGRKHSLGKGLVILFSGDSGTGKTMAAEIIATDLELDLYKIDLSTIVSKYIGETEKNLGKIFEEAETSNAILFFDEADALFGKRTEVKDSHDRYANIEVNYLLQKLEEHEGIVVLATNLGKNMDDAFVRRIHYAVSFPSPEREERLTIWKGVFPTEAPLAKDVDIPFLAKQFNVAGGSIKNIAVRAAFLAAQNSGTIHMEHIIRSAKREFQKMGRLCLESDFKQYHEQVK
jgi:hypothetical protein